jgi:hypothetical protein
MTSFVDKLFGKSETKSQYSGSIPDQEALEGIYPTYGADKEGVLNWYKQFPYTFCFNKKDNTTLRFNLPISPSNISISTKFATNTIATMYGTVEEHSEQRYYDISIVGTTGLSPRYYTTSDKVKEEKSKGAAPSGRQHFPISESLLPGLGGFFKRTKQLIDNTLNKVSDLLGQDEISSGINNSKTGYVAFHNFYKFLLLYKKDTSTGAIRKKHPLIFKNYKDQNQYYVVINNFTLTRDSSNPMLYNYNIQMRGYNLTKIDGQAIDKIDPDRFGLNLEPSTFAKMSNKANSARNAAISGISAVKGFGL